MKNIEKLECFVANFHIRKIVYAQHDNKKDVHPIIVPRQHFDESIDAKINKIKKKHKFTKYYVLFKRNVISFIQIFILWETIIYNEKNYLPKTYCNKNLCSRRVFLCCM